MKILFCATDAGGARNIGPIVLSAIKCGHNVVVLSSF